MQFPHVPKSVDETTPLSDMPCNVLIDQLMINIMESNGLEFTTKNQRDALIALLQAA